MIEIDGSYGSGGGQIIRTASALSAITNQPCRIFNVRQKRPKPGLKRSHLEALRALAQFSQAQLKGDFLDSPALEFYPRQITPQNLSLQIETAGSLTLVLQALLPVALQSPFPIQISCAGGATDTFFSPTIDYFRFVFLRILAKFGTEVNLQIKKRGFYPKGGARVEAKISPHPLKNIRLIKRGQLKQICLFSGASQNLSRARVAERQIAAARQILAPLKLPSIEKVEYYQTLSPGSQINLLAEFENTILGVDNLGKLGKSAEQVGQEAAQNFLKLAQSDACLDRHLADQILLYLALAPGSSRVKVAEITPHCQTNLWVIEQFLAGRFIVKNNLISWQPKSVPLTAACQKRRNHSQN